MSLTLAADVPGGSVPCSGFARRAARLFGLDAVSGPRRYVLQRDVRSRTYDRHRVADTRIHYNTQAHRPPVWAIAWRVPAKSNGTMRERASGLPGVQ